MRCWKAHPIWMNTNPISSCECVIRTADAEHGEWTASAFLLTTEIQPFQPIDLGQMIQDSSCRFG
jgi:hypothetical protein